MNKVILTGRLTAKPELNYTQSQMVVTKFTIAVDRFSKDKGADFIRVTVFGRQAENVCRYMDKGRMIAVEGSLQTGSYKGRDGKTVYTQDVIANHTEFLGGNSEPAREQTARQIEEDASALLGVDNFQSAIDDIPF
ncbi:MAG: single-stranded DNA-binding protein [Clostridiales bacterium]|nr:single-stranded DNA-binding protein [Clostridiales bacterium]MBQ1571348.1 single-stranded DNA-binding protein [Clostridiales bacterium]